MKRVALLMLLATTSTAALAENTKIMIEDAYARSTNPKVAAIFMEIMNHTDTADRLIGASSDAAKRVELHTHEVTDGVAKMIHVEEGFAVPDGGQASLARGGDHVMLMGLIEPLSQGDTVTITLSFEKAGEVTLDVPVDNERAEKGGHGHGHGHGHGN